MLLQRLGACVNKLVVGSGEVADDGKVLPPLSCTESAPEPI